MFSTPSSQARISRVTLTNPVFISDLHLSDDDKAGYLSRFLTETASDFDELIILGDFFDYWVGDDAASTVPAICAELRGYSEKRRLFFMQGNRDFILGENFCRSVGAVLLKDPCIAQCGASYLLLSHGDMWCTNDKDYQALRKKVRSRLWQWFMLCLPLKKRLRIAQDARRKSKATKSQKDASLMDVVDASVLRSLRNYPECSFCGVIHGHTHRPGAKEIAPGITRCVIPDWRFKDGKLIQSGYAVLENGKPVPRITGENAL